MPEQSETLEGGNEFRSISGEARVRLLGNEIAGVTDPIGRAFEDGPDADLVAEAGAKLDPVNEFLSFGVAQIVDPARSSG